jgi:hypothetical protein
LPQRTRASRAAARAAREGAGDLAVLNQYDLSDDESGNEDKGLNDNDNGIDEDEEQIEEEAATEAAKTEAIGTRAEVANKVGSNEGAKTDGLGLRHGMARLKAAMAVSGSMAARFAERARASRATAEEAATEHEGICRAIVEDQAGALGEALGPTATGRAYLAMLNAEGVFLVMHGLQWWMEAPGRTCHQCGKKVAFEGEVRTGTGVPNLWRFDEPEEQLFRPLTLPPVLLSDTAIFYAEEAIGEYYRATVVPDAGGTGWAPACGRLIPIPVEWAPMFLDYPDSGTAFCRLVDLINSVHGAEQDKFTYLAQSMAYACLSASEEEQPLSTMSSKWKRMVMSKTTRKWATGAWSEQPSPDEADEDCPHEEASPPTISDFSSVFGGQARRTAVTVPISNPPNRRERGGGSPKVATGILRQVGRGSLCRFNLEIASRPPEARHKRKGGAPKRSSGAGPSPQQLHADVGGPIWQRV